MTFSRLLAQALASPLGGLLGEFSCLNEHLQQMAAAAAAAAATAAAAACWHRPWHHNWEDCWVSKDSSCSSMQQQRRHACVSRVKVWTWYHVWLQCSNSRAQH
jgi:hypothetical protein